jgi:hypothetical protein
MIPVEELYEVLSKSRDFLKADNDQIKCLFCNRDEYDWHDGGCPISRLYMAVRLYDDVKDRKLPTW